MKTKSPKGFGPDGTLYGMVQSFGANSKTQPAIAREDRTTDGSVIMHQIEHHLSLTEEWMYWYK